LTIFIFPKLVVAERKDDVPDPTHDDSSIRVKPTGVRRAEPLLEMMNSTVRRNDD
jgi:hypothetical protein